MGVKPTSEGASAWHSRAATRIFFLVGYINRDRLFANLKVVRGKLPAELAPILHKIMQEQNLIQPEYQHLPWEELLPFHLSKTITERSLNVLAQVFNRREIEHRYVINHSRGELEIIESPLPPVVSDADLFSIDTLSIRAVLLRPEKPLLIEEMIERVGGEIPLSDLKSSLQETLLLLLEEGRVGRTLDDEYFWIEEGSLKIGKTFLLNNAQLFPIKGTHSFVSLEGREKRLRSGELVEVVGTQGPIYFLKNAFARALHAQTFVEVLNGGRLPATHFTEDGYLSAVQHGKVAFGLLSNGTQIKITATAEAKRFYRRDIFLFLLEKFIRDLEDRHSLAEEEKGAFRAKAWAIFKLWGKTPLETLQKNYYLAEKVIQLEGGPFAVLAALLDSVPYYRVEAELTASEVFPAKEIQEICQILHDYKISRNLPFHLSGNDAFYIQNFMWMLISLNPNPESIRLLMAKKTQSLVFREKGINPHEIMYLYAPLAERFGFSEIPEDFRNLLFQLNRPVQFRQYQQAIDSSVGMTFQESKAFLAEQAKKLKEELSALGISAERIRIKFRRKAEAVLYEKVEVRRQRTLEDNPDNLGLKIIIDCPKERGFSGTAGSYPRDLATAFEYLVGRYSLSASGIEDNVKNPRKSGWQAITLECVTLDDGKVAEIQLMTRQMFENEKFLRIKQAHWFYEIKRTIPRQRFDDYPLWVIERLTGNFDHDYPIIRGSLTNNWAFVFYLPNQNKLSAEQRRSLPGHISAGTTPASIKRLPKKSTAVDLAASAGKLPQYGGAEVYVFGLDSNDQATVVPYLGKQGPVFPKLGVEHEIETGSLVLLGTSQEGFAGKRFLINSACERAQRPSTIISLRRMVGDKQLANEEKHGAEGLTTLGFTPKQLGAIKRWHKFQTIDDLYAAVGAKLIRLEDLREFAEKAIIEPISPKALSVRSLDVKGLTHQILSHFSSDIPLVELASRSYLLYGELFTEVILKFGEAYLTKPGAIQRGIKFYLDHYTGREHDSSPFHYTLRLRPKDGQWKISSLIEKLANEGINIANFNLPNARSEMEGFLELEIGADTRTHMELFEDLLRELGEYPGVIEVSQAS